MTGITRIRLAAPWLALAALVVLSCEFGDAPTVPPDGKPANRPTFTVPADTLRPQEGDPVSITLDATNPGGGELVYSMIGPEGAELDGNVFTWAPGYDQSGAHEIIFIVHEAGKPDKADTVRIVVNVAEANQPPYLQFLNDTTVQETQLLQLTLTAVDVEHDSLIYSVLNPPAGASFAGRVFSWRPDSTQAGDYPLYFVVRQAGAPALNDTLRLVVTVTPFEEAGTSNLVAYWDFNEGTGNVIGDRTGGGRNATITGGGSWVAGIQGTGYRFTGVKTNYAVSPTAFPDMTQQTLSIWVYLSVIKMSCFIQESNAESGRDNEIGIVSDGRVMYRTRDEGVNGEPTDQHFSKAKLETNRWYYLAATATADTVKIYINGVLDTVKAGSFHLSGYHYQIQIGRKYDGNTAYDFSPNGILDEIKLYDKALTAAQIRNEWKRYNPALSSLPKR